MNASQVQTLIDPDSRCWNYADFLGRNPAALPELVDVFEELVGSLGPEHVRSLLEWTQALGVDQVSGYETPHTIGLTYAGDGGDYRLTANKPEGWIRSEERDHDARILLAQAERQWMLQGVWAPVVIATLKGQSIDPDRGDILPSTDDTRFSWDASLDFLTIAPDKRNGACEHDTDESDTLRFMDSACAQAQAWEGPFAVEAQLYLPGTAVRAEREMRRLELSVPAAAKSLKMSPRL